MKHNYQSFINKGYLLLILLGLTFSNTYSQTPLSAGDIVITGYNADGGDEFSFLLLVDIDASTVINFTDQGWTGSAFFTGSSTEGVAVWTSGAALTCGTEIVISATSATSSSADTGTTTGGFDFATSGDQIIAYQGLASSPSFITAFHNENGAFDATTNNVNDSALPTGLIEGISAFAVNPEIDNVVYSGTTISGTALDIRTAIYSNSSNAAQSSNYTTSNSPSDPTYAQSQILSPINWSFSSCLAAADTDPPVVQSILLQGSPTATATSIIKRVTFDENANNITTDDFTLTTTGTASGTIASVSANSGTTVDVTINSITGEGTLRLDHLGTSNITDDSGNGNGTNGNVAAFTSGSVHTVELVAPRVQSITRQTPSASPTNADVLVFAIQFTETVTNVTTDDFSVSGTTGTIASAIDQGSNTYFITISGGDLATFNGTVFLGFRLSQNITDTAGNALTNTSSIDPPQNYTVDNLAPTIAIGAPSTADTNSGPVTYTITYTNADAVTLANGDISLNITGTANGNVAVTGTGTATRTVTISSITGNGTIGISLAASTANDTAGNNALAAGPSATFNVDNTAPTVTIGAPSTANTNSGPVTYTITYTNADAVTLANGDISLNTTGTATGNVAVTGTGTATRTVTISSITGDGTIGISLAANTANDTAGNNALAAGPSATFNVDNTAPTVTIGAPSTANTNSGPVTYTITYTNADAVTLANGDISLNTTGTATGNVAVTGTGTATRTVTISSITGDGTIGISLAASTANDTAGNNALAAGPSATFNVDNTAPTVTIGAPSTANTNSGPVTYTITYTNADAVTLANGDISLNTTGTANGNVAVTGTGTATRTVTISSITGDGTIGISLAASTANDTAGNNALAAGPSATFNVDNTAPTVTIGAPSTADTNSGPVTYTITYTNADAVTLANGDISLNTTGTVTGNVAVTGTGTATRTVTISSITGDGTIGISLAASTANDTAGNNALAAGPSATFNVDNTAPTVTIGAPSTADTNSGPVTYTITYTNADAVTLANGDISLNTTGTATGNVAVTGTGTATRTVTISSITGDGTIGISLAASTANDTAGNNALAAGPSATFNVDNTAPTVTIGAPSTANTNSGPVTYTITYTNADAVTLANGDISLNTTGTANGNVAVTGTGTATRTVTISSITGDGTIGISLAASTANDTAGNNALAAGPSATFNVDNTAPTVTIGAPSTANTNSGPVTYTITYTNADAVTLANGDISLNTTGTATGNVAVTGTGTTTRTVTISSITGDGTIGISLAASTANDTAGNNALAVGPSATFNVTNAPIATASTAPTVLEDATNVALADDIDVTDTDSDDQTVTFTVTGGTVSLGTTGITFGGSGNGSASFTAQGTLAAINTALDAATFTPTANLNGTNAGIISFTTNDGTNTSSAASVTFNITSVNDEPSFTKGANESILEDAGAQTVNNWATALDKGAPNENGQTLTFTVVNNNNGLFSVQPAIDSNGNLTYTPTADANGVATVSVVLTDDGGTANGGDDTFATQQFTITVNSVNDEPSFTKGANELVSENAGAQTINNWATALDKGATNESGQTLNFTVVNNNNGLFSAQPAIDSNGNLTYTPTSNTTGTATVSVILMDDGGTANGGDDTFATQTFTIEVSAVLGVQDELLSGLTIYPIPNNGIINIAANTNLQLKNIEVFDIAGKRIYAKDLDKNSAINTIDISNAESGIYLIKISSINATAIKRIIKE